VQQLTPQTGKMQRSSELLRRSTTRFNKPQH